MTHTMIIGEYTNHILVNNLQPYSSIHPSIQFEVTAGWSLFQLSKVSLDRLPVYHMDNTERQTTIDAHIHTLSQLRS